MGSPRQQAQMASLSLSLSLSLSREQCCFFPLQILNRKPLAQKLSVPHKQPRHGNQRHGDECQQAVAPAQAELLVHGPAGKRENGAEQGAHHRVGGESRGGVDGKRIDKV